MEHGALYQASSLPLPHPGSGSPLAACLPQQSCPLSSKLGPWQDGLQPVPALTSAWPLPGQQTRCPACSAGRGRGGGGQGAARAWLCGAPAGGHPARRRRSQRLARLGRARRRAAGLPQRWSAAAGCEAASVGGCCAAGGLQTPRVSAREQHQARAAFATPGGRTSASLLGAPAGRTGRAERQRRREPGVQGCDCAQRRARCGGPARGDGRVGGLRSRRAAPRRMPDRPPGPCARRRRRA